MTPNVAAHYAPLPRIPERDLNPPDGQPGPEPERTAKCAICNCDGYLLDGAWYTDDSCDEELLGAADTPDGEWVCRPAHYSEKMHRALGEDAWKLDAIADALLSINEHMDVDTRDHIDLWLINAPVIGSSENATDLNRAALKLLRDIRQCTEPSWLNRPRREERLESAAESVARDLEMRPMIELTSWAASIERVDEPYPVYSRTFIIDKLNRIARSVAGAIGTLREAAKQ